MFLLSVPHRSVILCSIANILVTATEFNLYFAYILAYCGNPSLVCVVGNYLLIHLREAGDARRNGGTSYKPNLSSIDFQIAEDRVVPGKHTLYSTYII